MACGEGQQRGCLDCVFLMSGRAGVRGYGTALRGDILWVSDRGEGAHVLEAIRDLLHSYEGEDA